MKNRLFTLTLIASLGLLFPAAAKDFTAGKLTVSNPWARASAGRMKNGAAYLVLTNKGQKTDRLVEATTPVARKASLHESVMEGGVMKMRPVKPIVVGPGATVMLKPGGLHLMLMGLKAPLKEGEMFPLTLTFEKAGHVEVKVMVRKPGAMGSGHRMGKGH